MIDLCGCLDCFTDTERKRLIIGWMNKWTDGWYGMTSYDMESHAGTDPGFSPERGAALEGQHQTTPNTILSKKENVREGCTPYNQRENHYLVLVIFKVGAQSRHRGRAPTETPSLDSPKIWYWQGIACIQCMELNELMDQIEIMNRWVDAYGLVGGIILHIKTKVEL